MADTKLNSTLFSNRSDIFVAAGVILVLAMMLIPLPTFLLDSFMSFNLMLSLLVILIVLYSKNTTDFSIFPTLLLVSTVFGLALNISSTRLILSKGAEFDGKLVRAFCTVCCRNSRTGRPCNRFYNFYNSDCCAVYRNNKRGNKSC